jgi:catalase
MLKEPAFDFSDVEQLAETACEWYREKKFRPSQGERLLGYAPPGSIYNT